MYISCCYRYGKRQSITVHCYIPFDTFDALVAVNPLLRAGKPALGALAVNDGHARILTPTAFDAFTLLRK